MSNIVCWIDALLYSAPRLQKKEMETFDLVVSLQPRVGRSHWYETVVESVEFLSLEIPEASIHQDTGRAIKDKDISTKKLCRKIVDHLRDKKRVAILCRNGYTTAGFLALACKCWYDTTPLEDAIKTVRDNGDFTTAKSKEQRAQMVRILEYAKEIDTCPFIKRRKLTKQAI